MQKQINTTVFFLVLLIAGLIVLPLMNPLSETMTCSSDKVCKIKQSFWGGITFNKRIKVKENTNFDIVEQRREIWGKRGSVRRVTSTHFYYQIKINNKKIFIKPYIEDVFSGIEHNGDNASRRLCAKELQEFYLYKNGEKPSYTISSGASDSELKFFAILWIVVMSVLLLWSVFDKDAGPETKNKIEFLSKKGK